MGVTEESRARALARRVGVVYYVFDVLYLDGHDLTRLPLRARKALLRRALAFAPRCASPFTATPAASAICGRRAAGAGRADRQARGQPVHAPPLRRLAEVQVRAAAGAGGRRLHRTGGQPHRLRALLVGYYEGRSCGTREGRHRLRRTHPAGVAPPPGPARPRGAALHGSGGPRAGVHWVRPELVAEVGFTEWTGDDRLRHPRFLGLRDDKPATDVVRERPTGSRGKRG
ncbi:hypothetical protein NKH77_53790 [Streptomyces sp. M19]